MKKLWSGFALAIAGLIVAAGTVSADGGYCCVCATTAAFPTGTPPGWYTNTYLYDWHYPWYAYYNFSQGPYANWLLAKGVAGYGNQKLTPVIPMPAQVTIHLPEDATLSFSGVVANGTGDVRSFSTPVLALNQDYVYEMTVEVIRGGKTLKISKQVTVHAGEDVKVIVDLPPPEPAAPQQKPEEKKKGEEKKGETLQPLKK
jgi:uncharacterized protein (TIGR03000 family)